MERKVFTRHLKLSKEFSKGLHTLNGYEMYDIVQLGGRDVGIIISISRNTLNVLTQVNIKAMQGIHYITFTFINFSLSLSL